MNINNPTTFGTPNLTLSTSNSSGTGGALRADDTVLVYDTTNPTTIAYSASAAVGSAATSARRDHTHGMAASDAVGIASLAELEAETDTDKYVPPDLIRYSPGVTKCYGWTNSSGSLQSGDFNLISVNRDATGIFSWTIDDDFDDTNYTVMACVGTLTAGGTAVYNSRNVGVFGIEVSVADGTNTDIEHAVAVYGNQEA